MKKTATTADTAAPETPEKADPIAAEAAAEVAKSTPADVPKGITEEQIREKVRAGLDRKQAIQVLTLQAEHDAAQKKKG